MHRFYNPNVKGEKNFTLEEVEIIHQITKVFRSNVWDEYIFFNGKEYTDYIYKLEEIEKKKLVFSLVKEIKKSNIENDIHLYQAIPNKTQKIEYIIQKGVEIGINSFIFFEAERSQKLHLSENKIERYVKIAIEALEQSNGNILPHIEFMKELPEIMGENILFLHTDIKKAKSLKEAKNIGTGTQIMVGPEGGWSEREVEEFTKKKYTQVYLWERIMRTETVSSVVAFYIRNR